MTKTKVPALEQRWINELSAFNFTIQYRSGSTNIGADALSRLPNDCPQLIENEPTVSLESINVSDILSSTAIPLEIQETAIDQIFLKLDTDSEESDGLTDLTATNLPTYKPEDMSKFQHDDPLISRLIHYRSLERLPSKKEIKKEPKPVQLLLKQWSRVVLKNDVLYRRMTGKDGQTRLCVLLPICLRNQVLHYLHDLAGHQAGERTEALLRERCWFPEMSKTGTNLP